MIVYGDRRRTDTPARVLASVEAILTAACAQAGQERYDLLTQALIEAGELLQGLADAEFDARGFDDVSAVQDAGMELVLTIARQLHGYWRGDDRRPDVPRRELAAVRGFLTERPVCLKVPEGYAFYAVHPDDYFAAATSYAWPSPPLVIGLRSIGTSLAAAVAAATGGSAISVRPAGHPFSRELRLSATLKSRLVAHAGPFAIVDEGPGLSGSSFGAAADLLESLGVEAERMVFLPSHAGPLGARASARHLERWSQARKLVASFDETSSAENMRRWFGELGPRTGVEDLSAGQWRGDYDKEARPPAAPGQERRKYRWRIGPRRYVVRYAGLGAVGQAKLARSRALHKAGFGAEPIALRRGFLLERWVEGARLDPFGPERGEFLPHLGRYLGFRAANFPAKSEEGAGLEALREMAGFNAAALCGEKVADRVAAALAGLAELDVVPVHVDGRLQPWEWVRRPDGGFCKADALDHSCDHSLPGCQDIAWDIAGAAVELGLSGQEVEDLRSAVARIGGRAVSSESVRVLGLCYAAFQGGSWLMAEEAALPPEQSRLRRRRLVYAEALRAASGDR
jgi:hypothetical protein